MFASPKHGSVLYYVSYGKEDVCSFVDNSCGLRAAHQHNIMLLRAQRSGRNTLRSQDTHNGTLGLHFTHVGYRTFGPLIKNVPVGSEPNVTLIAPIQGQWPSGSQYMSAITWKTTGINRLFGNSHAPQLPGRKLFAVHVTCPNSRSLKRDGNGRYLAAAVASRRHDVSSCALISHHPRYTAPHAASAQP
jgi:hypothetical protein